jgi:RNA polymerase sigma factor (sigma-70 family)
MDLRDEGELIRRLQQHDEKAFQKCVKLYQDKVYGLVFRMLGSHSEAEDVAQEVFVTVFKSIDSFRGDSKLSTWLFRIAANHCKNRIKYLKRRAHKTTSELNDDAAEAASCRGRSQARCCRSTPVRSRRSKACSSVPSCSGRSPSSTKTTACCWCCAMSKSCRTKRSCR